MYLDVFLYPSGAANLSDKIFPWYLFTLNLVPGIPTIIKTMGVNMATIDEP